MAKIFLEKGDIIDVIAPSHKPLIDIKDKIIIEVVKIIEEMGFKARIALDIFDYNQDSFCANSILYRKEKFVEALYNRESKAIWCLQGGYGASNFIADLSKLIPPADQKILIGFSDITVLHIYLNCKWGWPTIHYRNLSQLCNKNNENVSKEEINSVKNFLLGKQHQLSYEMIPLNNIDFADEGELIGGNLCLIATSIGTNWQIIAQDKFLFIEEVDERGYAVDRLFYHLEQAGIFSGIKALLIGDIICNPEKDGSTRCDLAVKNLRARVKFPIFRIKGFGHSKENGILPFNLKCKIANNRLMYAF